MAAIKHGKYGIRIYRIWTKVKNRCLNKNNDAFKHYGGRGIKICDRWMEFQNFYDDMFPTYSDGLSIERVDNNGNYEPGNCIWIPRTAQSRNRRRVVLHSVDGVLKTQSEIYLGLGMRYITFTKWIAMGFTAEEIVGAKTEMNKLKKRFLQLKDLMEWTRKTFIKPQL